MRQIVSYITSSLLINKELKLGHIKIKNVEFFVLNQIKKSPNYIRFVVLIFSFILLIIFKIYSLIIFDRTLNRVNFLIKQIKKYSIPIFKDLIILYESLILLRILDKTYQKKI